MAVISATSTEVIGIPGLVFDKFELMMHVVRVEKAISIFIPICNIKLENKWTLQF